jgi:hypothetical protein
MSDLFKLVNMNEISLEIILELLVYKSNLISKCAMLKDIIIKEFNRRFERQSLNSKEFNFCEELVEKLTGKLMNLTRNFHTKKYFLQKRFK